MKKSNKTVNELTMILAFVGAMIISAVVTAGVAQMRWIYDEHGVSATAPEQNEAPPIVGVVFWRRTVATETVEAGEWECIEQVACGANEYVEIRVKDQPEAHYEWAATAVTESGSTGEKLPGYTQVIINRKRPESIRPGIISPVDVNGDGWINAVDVQAVVNGALGIK